MIELIIITTIGGIISIFLWKYRKNIWDFVFKKSYKKSKIIDKLDNNDKIKEMVVKIADCKDRYNDDYYHNFLVILASYDKKEENLDLDTKEFRHTIIVQIDSLNSDLLRKYKENNLFDVFVKLYIKNIFNEDLYKRSRRINKHRSLGNKIPKYIIDDKFMKNKKNRKFRYSIEYLKDNINNIKKEFNIKIN